MARKLSAVDEKTIKFNTMSWAFKVLGRITAPMLGMLWYRRLLK
jgi:hypothetical protein